jgi:hypothetical protein
MLCIQQLQVVGVCVLQPPLLLLLLLLPLLLLLLPACGLSLQLTVASVARPPQQLAWKSRVIDALPALTVII